MSLRQALNENVSVKFLDTPLVSAVRVLAKQTKTDIRLDTSALRASKVREREPVTLTLSDRRLSTVLHVLLADLDLTWILRDGVLWITSVEQAAEHLKTAVYDVRDLCRNQDESSALTAAIQAQTHGPWQESDGSGGAIVFAKTGTMVIRHTESGLREVQDLLANYRKALLASKPREANGDRRQEVVTRYYRMHEEIAEDLAEMLPQLVQPETWTSEQRPDAPGFVLKVASGPELLDPRGRSVQSDTKAGEKSKTLALVVSNAVLIIRQTRATHDEIVKVIRRIELGDSTEASVAGGMGGGMMGGMGVDLADHSSQLASVPSGLSFRVTDSIESFYNSGLSCFLARMLNSSSSSYLLVLVLDPDAAIEDEEVRGREQDGCRACSPYESSFTAVFSWNSAVSGSCSASQSSSGLGLPFSN